MSTPTKSDADYQREADKLATLAIRAAFGGWQRPENHAQVCDLTKSVKRVLELATLLQARDQLEELQVKLGKAHQALVDSERVRKSVEEVWHGAEAELTECRSSLAAEQQAHRECHAGMVVEVEKLNSEITTYKTETLKIVTALGNAGQLKDVSLLENVMGLVERLAKLSQPEKQIADWVFNANELQKDNNRLRADNEALRLAVKACISFRLTPHSPTAREAMDNALTALTDKGVAIE